jgi:hypothetical protein
VAQDTVQLLASPGAFHSLSSSSEFLSLTPIPDSDIFKALKHLKPSEPVGLHIILGSDIKGCSETLIPALKRMFTLSLSQQYFPTLWKQPATVFVFKNAVVPLLATTDPYLNLLCVSMLLIT